MKKLLYSSILLLAMSCGTSEETVDVNPDNGMDSTKVEEVAKDSMKAIIHGSPNQEELDSLKKVKQENKKKLD